MESQFTNSQIDRDKIKKNLFDVLSFVGDNPDREGLQDTPERMIKSYKTLYGGYNENPEEILSTCFKDGTCQELVILKQIEFYSTCEHHMLPFFGSISIGYIPNKKIVGISKLARIVDVFARRLQIQERLTSEIADTIETVLNPVGVMVTCNAQHFCMTSRGVQKQNSIMVTSAIRGAFKIDNLARNEFLELIK